MCEGKTARKKASLLNKQGFWSYHVPGLVRRKPVKSRAVRGPTEARGRVCLDVRCDGLKIRKDVVATVTTDVRCSGRCWLDLVWDAGSACNIAPISRLVTVSVC